jgi:hypothetical protein
MNEQKSSTDITKGFSNALRDFSDYLAIHGSTTCERYVLIALSNSDVQRNFIDHIEKNDLFIGTKCYSIPETSEEVRIVFMFKCLPPKLSLVPHSFMLRLNIVSSKVIELIEPYHDTLLINSGNYTPQTTIGTTGTFFPHITTGTPTTASTYTPQTTAETTGNFFPHTTTGTSTTASTYTPQTTAGTTGTFFSHTTTGTPTAASTYTPEMTTGTTGTFFPHTTTGTTGTPTTARTYAPEMTTGTTGTTASTRKTENTKVE